MGNHMKLAGSYCVAEVCNSQGEKFCNKISVSDMEFSHQLSLAPCYI